MSRQQSQGVVLTGYHSNAELLQQTGPRESSCPPVPDSNAHRWEVRLRVTDTTLMAALSYGQRRGKKIGRVLLSVQACLFMSEGSKVTVIWTRICGCCVNVQALNKPLLFRG